MCLLVYISSPKKQQPYLSKLTIANDQSYSMLSKVKTKPIKLILFTCFLFDGVVSEDDEYSVRLGEESAKHCGES